VLLLVVLSFSLLESIVSINAVVAIWLVFSVHSSPKTQIGTVFYRILWYLASQLQQRWPQTTLPTNEAPTTKPRHNDHDHNNRRPKDWKSMPMLTYLSEWQLIFSPRSSLIATVDEHQKLGTKTKREWANRTGRSGS
jgi:hypothetical protein